MSIELDEARHAGGAGGLETSVCLAASDGSVNTKPNPQTQAAIADLHREFIAECLKIVAMKASHGADNVLLGDDLNAERDIHLAIEKIREASKAFHEGIRHAVTRIGSAA
jgi:hypothetical protein